ncbi:MAG: endonuclease/exonuclease/phosphatase family protein [Sediminicola sp.]|tara:strand:- start:41396 stop:42313 length:918 start_codon:yes stop_codon:yes gene_type:complete
MKNLLLLSQLLLWSFALQGQTLRVASYNIRYDSPSDSLDNWKYRKNTVAKLVQFHDFDIFGTQEALDHQLEQLLERLPGYAYIGVGRDDGKKAGEFAAILYKEEMFQLLDQGHFWLSEDTSKPNKGWDAALPRICTWGKFEHRESGFTFYMFNAHFDHVGTVAREESAKLILAQIGKIATNAPVLLTGDFNVDQKSGSYKVLQGSDLLEDAYLEADLTYGASGTFNSFKVDTNTDQRIDHIFITDRFKVLKYGILTDTYQTGKDETSVKADSGNFPKETSLYKHQARLPSDHYPILSVLQIISRP